jgi:drug/metabolite transporter (DMT)-like permease
VVVLRLCISVVFLLIFAFSLKKMEKIRPGDLKFFILIAVFEPFLYFMGESFGLTYVSSTMASVIIATIPLFVPVAAYLIYRERLNLFNKIGLLISFGGVILVVLSSEAEFSATLKGVLLMFLAVLSAVGYTLNAKRLSKNYNGFTITSYQNIFGLILFLPFFFIWDFSGFLVEKPSTEAILSVLYLGIFGSSVTFVLFTQGVRELGASRANFFTNLIPVFTAVASYIFFRESMTILKISGILLVLFGLVMTQVKTLRRKKGRKNGEEVIQYQA